MCGIALILAGVHVIPDSEPKANSAAPELPEASTAHEPYSFHEANLKAALGRRGPDSFGSRRVTCVGTDAEVEMSFFSAVLQLRGLQMATQPMVSASGDVLVFNGEIFDGVHVPADKNDAEALLGALEGCCSCSPHALDQSEYCSCCTDGRKSVPQVLSAIRGPWALVYWQNISKTLWFGRDAFGRRSLLVHWPTKQDSRFLLSSVSPTSTSRDDQVCASTSNILLAAEAESVVVNLPYWEELPCGIRSARLEYLKACESPKHDSFFVEVKNHEWQDAILQKLIRWERKIFVPPVGGISLHSASQDKHKLPHKSINGTERMSTAPLSKDEEPQLENFVHLNLGDSHFACVVLSALQNAVKRRTVLNILEDEADKLSKNCAPIAILFSGGLDSMIIAALLNQCLDSSYTIDLLNVSFDGPHAPDRVSARAGLKELQSIAPYRSWRLVEIDAALESLKQETEHILALLHPSRTYMDLTIGTALWLASRGDGWVDGELCKMQDKHLFKYKSTSRVLLLGSGADEQCGGYVRHRTKYRLGGWVALNEEMRLDVQRIWKRNMGRDDRIISDNGKEARYPFLDEDVMRILLDVPLWHVATLDEPLGKGDKKILREVAKLLGLEKAALLPKRAIQFGSRIARETNRSHFGSIRAANLASAGSADIRGLQG